METVQWKKLFFASWLAALRPDSFNPSQKLCFPLMIKAMSAHWNNTMRFEGKKKNNPVIWIPTVTKLVNFL